MPWEMEDNSASDIIMCFEERPAGTAGAVKLLEDRLEDTFVVASGDVLADVDIRSLVERIGMMGQWRPWPSPP